MTEGVVMFTLTDELKKDFERDGYIIVRSLFSDSEITVLKDKAKSDKEIEKNSFTTADDEGGKVRLSLWNYPGDDIYGRVVRSRRMVDTMQSLLGDEVYHYHSKMILKDPKVGGAWDWHQDYGYWYANGRPWRLHQWFQYAEHGCRLSNASSTDRSRRR